jgi:hypothetical protein
MKINTFLKNSARLILALIIAATTFMFHTPGALAWEQGANGSHEEINKYAVNRFLSASASNPKYANSLINVKQQFWGTETTSASLPVSGFTSQKSNLTFSQWVIHGGFSADEPEIWACVRHFYDPLSANGVPQLTDHLALHGFVYDTISAKEWAFESTENPYGWRQALEYYKQAMELTDDSQETVVGGKDFRDPGIKVNSAAEARSAYLGKSFRALGETMHMMADITQPSHVRNDSHPSIDLDPLESTINKDTVILVKDSPVEASVGAYIESAPTLADLYEQIASFTNSKFYTDDTIYDGASGVKPRNWENPYPSPQFSDLALDPKSSLKIYVAKFNGKPVRMVQQTYTSWKLGALWQDYIVPPSFTTEQADVLVPIAIKANARVIDSFFPTFDLTLEVKENKAASTNGDANYHEYSLETQLKHLQDNDLEWRNSGLEIKYSGPAELWGETKGKALKIADLKFKKGLPLNPQTVFTGDEKYQKADKYLINAVDTLYITIDAGGRLIKSKKFSLPVQLSISPTTLAGEPNKTYTFTAKTDQVLEKSRYDWYLDNKKVQSGTGTTYKFQPKDEGDYSIMVKLFNKDGKEVANAEAEATAYSKKPDSATPGDLKDTRYVSVWMKANIGSDFGRGKVNIPITWSGASFTGSYSGSWDANSKEPLSLTVTGVISPDGKKVMSITYAQQLTFTVQKKVETTRFESKDLPLYKKDVFDDDTHLIYMVTGSECKDHLSSIDVSVDSVSVSQINSGSVVALMATFKLNNNDAN